MPKIGVLELVLICLLLLLAVGGAFLFLSADHEDRASHALFNPATGEIVQIVETVETVEIEGSCDQCPHCNEQTLR